MESIVHTASHIEEQYFRAIGHDIGPLFLPPPMTCYKGIVSILDYDTQPIKPGEKTKADARVMRVPIC